MTELVRSVLWRRLDQPGAETCELRGGKDGSHLYGVTVLALEGRPTVVRYHVACDLAWRTRSVDVGEKWGGDVRVLHLTNEQGKWRDKASAHVGDGLGDADGGVDVDLGLTPAT